MVNTGSPSAGCELCRQRKIRCDETKPACRKCTKYGRVCPGYRDIESKTLSKKGKTSKSSRPDIWNNQEASKSAPGMLEGPDSFIKHEDQDQRPVQPPTQYSLSPVLPPIHRLTMSRSASPSSMYHYPIHPAYMSSTTAIEPAIHCLFTSHAFAVCAITDSDIDSVGMIKDMYQTTAYGSCLDICTKAAALANLSNRLERSDLHVEARTQYGDAIHALNATLQSPTDRIADETLLSMLMLRLTEFFFGLQTDATIFGPKSCASDNWVTHLGGALTILRMRGVNQLATPQGRWLFDITFRSEICKMLWDCREVDEYLCHLEDQLDLFQPSWMSPILTIYRYYYRTVLRIKSRVKQLCDIAPAQPYPQTMSEINSLVQAAQNLDLDLERWRRENPAFGPEQSPSETTRSHKLPSTLSQNYFSHPKVAMFGRRLDFMRFKLHESLIQGLAATVKTLERQQGLSSTRVVTSSSFAAVDRHLSKHQAILHDVALGLLSSTSYMFGDVDESGQMIEFEPERSSSRYSPYSSGRSTPTSHKSRTPAIEVSYEDQASNAGSVHSLSIDDFRKRNYPSRLRTIEAYVHSVAIQGCEYLGDDDDEGPLGVRAIGGLVSRRGCDELRSS